MNILFWFCIVWRTVDHQSFEQKEIIDVVSDLLIPHFNGIFLPAATHIINGDRVLRHHTGKRRFGIAAHHASGILKIVQPVACGVLFSFDDQDIDAVIDLVFDYLMEDFSCLASSPFSSATLAAISSLASSI